MIQVKIIQDITVADLEVRVNEFLKELPENALVDITFTHSMSGNNSTDYSNLGIQSNVTALVVYKK
jgi:hypothetical protein